jgi:antitoxin (DNA-binding transcriptional repressor) of toxin-antitoxin stability system
MIMQTITATEFVRQFSDVINRTKYRGESFLIERGGEIVAQVTPANPKGCTPDELIALLEALPKHDQAYWDDLEAIHRHQPMMDGVDPWEQ